MLKAKKKKKKVKAPSYKTVCTVSKMLFVCRDKQKTPQDKESKLYVTGF